MNPGDLVEIKKYYPEITLSYGRYAVAPYKTFKINDNDVFMICERFVVSEGYSVFSVLTKHGLMYGSCDYMKVYTCNV